jgi:hypothetical protein
LHLDSGRMQWLTHVAGQQTLFDLINGLGGVVGHLLETNPNQDGTADMIALAAPIRHWQPSMPVTCLVSR